MSRVGKVAVQVPSGVKLNIHEHTVRVSGKLGTLEHKFPEKIKLIYESDAVRLEPANDNKEGMRLWGLSRTILNNMVVGVSEGFEKKLEIVGVGYKASVDGKYLTLSLGYSHDIKFEIPDDIIIKAIKPTLLSIFGFDKQKVGQVASFISKLRPPEPYKGKGIKEEGEVITRKEGKKK
jgi:large subunit ribosomal protein L6